VRMAVVSRHRAAILSEIIINENLKLLQINYLVRKANILFNFPSRSHFTCNKTYGKARYIVLEMTQLQAVTELMARLGTCIFAMTQLQAVSDAEYSRPKYCPRGIWTKD